MRLDAQTAQQLDELVLRVRAELPAGASCSRGSCAAAILAELLREPGQLCGRHLDPEHQLLLQMRGADRRERDRAQVLLLQAWAPRIRRLAWQCQGRDVQQADLIAAGQLGLLEAAARWQLGQGWVGYALAWVRKALQRCVRHSGVISQSEHALKRAARTGETAKPKGWAGLERL